MPLARPFLAGLFGLAALPSLAASDSPFVWEIQGPHARHCLVGSVHALPASVSSLPDNIEACYRRSRVLVLEAISSTVLDETEYVRRVGEIAERDPGGLRQRIGPQLYQRLTEEAGRLGLQAQQFDRFRPWFAAEMLAAFRALRSLARVEHGVDSQLYWRAVREKKEIVALETDQARAAVLTQMPDDAAVDYLAATLEDASVDAASSPQAVAMWMGGDDNGLERALGVLQERYPAYYRRVLADRNRAWLPSLQVIVKGRQGALIAIGMAHLAGPDSVRRLLWKEKIATPALRSEAPLELTPDP